MSGKIPAFGNWDYANDLPITQYFESARQAGLVRYRPPSTIKKATRNKESKESMKMMKHRPPKPVDEDLYKIPPELLRTTKRKKVLGFISNCLLPAACVS